MSLDLIIGAAKKDPRFKQMKGEDYDKPESKDEDMSEDGGDQLDEQFSAGQAAAIRSYVDSCLPKSK